MNNSLRQEQVYTMFANLREQINQLEQICTQMSKENHTRWVFPQNNYTVLAIWLLYDPLAQELFPVTQKKSWAELCEKLSKYVGWTVDEHILRRNFIRKYIKKDQNGPKWSKKKTTLTSHRS